MRTLCLVSCVGKKRATLSRAEHLYQSQWFKSAAQYARRNGDAWAILSAEHGVLLPSERVDPYEKTLNNMPIGERKTWANRVIYALDGMDWDRLEILAGAKYREFIIPWLDDQGHEYSIPMQGLGIGQQLQWLKKANSVMAVRRAVRDRHTAI